MTRRRLPETSIAAHVTRTAAGTDLNHEDAVAVYLAVHGPRTADELNTHYDQVGGWPANAAQKALGQLKRKARVIDTGDRRLTRAGNRAAVYRLRRPDEVLTDTADGARAAADIDRRELLARIEDTIEHTGSDRLPRAIRIPDLELTVTIRADHDTRPGLPA